MKKLAFWILVSMAAVLVGYQLAQAAPFLVCDPQAGVTHYKITGDSFWTANVPAQADGSLRSDLAGIASGTHNIQIAACKQDATWGEVCSATVPFTFTKPAAPTAPANTRLAP